MTRRMNAELREAKRKRAFKIWDVEGIDFSSVILRDRLNVSWGLYFKWKQAYKKEKGIK